MTSASPKAYSIVGFCRAYGISKTTFYKLKNNGKAPVVTSVDGTDKKLILASDAQKWADDNRANSVA